MYMSALPFGWLGIVYTDWTPICFGLIYRYAHADKQSTEVFSNVTGECYIMILYLVCIICSYFNVTSLNRYEARSKLFIDQGRTTLYRLLRYIGQYRCNP